MGQLRLTFVLCLTAAVAMATAARSDVTVSTSGDPAAAISAELAALLGRETLAMNTVTPGDVDRLKTTPNRSFFSARSTPDFVHTRVSIDAMAKVSGDAQWRCLTEALYFEARGEGIKGQFAVAEVILNRVDSARFPSTVCRVVNQGTGRLHACQFSYTCDGRSERITDKASWERMGKIARVMLSGGRRLLTGGATHYHTTAVRPRWSRVFPLTTTIGAHRFYRMETRVASSS